MKTTTTTTAKATACRDAQAEIDAAMGMADKRILSHTEVGKVINAQRKSMGLPAWTAKEFETNILEPAKRGNEMLQEARKKDAEQKIAQFEAQKRQQQIRSLEDEKKILQLQAEVAKLKEPK